MARTAAAAVTLANGGWAVGEHLTLHQVDRVTYPADQLTLTNSLLVAVTHLGSPYTFLGAHNATNSAAGVFQAVGAGEHYLAAGSANRNAGSSNISPVLLEDLRTLTTYSPIPLSGPITTATTLSPVVARDSDGVPDLGYHYSPLDYLASNVVVQAALTLTNGVAVGTYGSYGFRVDTSESMAGEGGPLHLNRLVQIQNVQEQARAWGSGPQCYQASGTYSPDITLRFTELSSLPGTCGATFSAAGGYDLQRLSLQDWRIRCGSVAMYPVSSSAVHLALTHNVLERCSFEVYKWYSGADTPISLAVYNNLFRGGHLTLYYEYGASLPYWQVKDNLLDGADQVFQKDASGDLYVQRSHNGFTSGTANNLGGSANVLGKGVPDPSGATFRMGRFDPKTGQTVFDDVGHFGQDVKGLSLVEKEGKVFWSNDSISSPKILTADEVRAVESSLRQAFPNATIEQVKKITDALGK